MREESQLKHVWIWKSISFVLSAAKLPRQWNVTLSCIFWDLILHMELKLLAGARQWFLMCGISEHERKIRRVCKFPRWGRVSRVLDGLAAWGCCIDIMGLPLLWYRGKKFELEMAVWITWRHTYLELISDQNASSGKTQWGKTEFSPTISICRLTTFTEQPICVASLQKSPKQNRSHTKIHRQVVSLPF